MKSHELAKWLLSLPDYYITSSIDTDDGGKVFADGLCDYFTHDEEIVLHFESSTQQTNDSILNVGDINTVDTYYIKNVEEWLSMSWTNKDVLYATPQLLTGFTFDNIDDDFGGWVG